MTEKPTYEELEQRIAFLEHESHQRKHFEAIHAALLLISHAVNTTSSLDDLFRSIHLALGSVIDTTNFYIALYDRRKDSVTFPYIIDTVDKCYPPIIDISKTASLTAEVIRTRNPLMATKSEIISRHNASKLEMPACTPAEIWLGVPLKAQDEIIGVMVVQNYHDPLCYDQTDLNVMVAVADQIAMALIRKQTEESLRTRESYLSAIIENQPGLLWLKDQDGRFLAVNNKFSNSCGLENPELLVGKTDLDVWPQEFAARYIADDVRVMKSGTPRMVEELISDKGVVHWFETFKAPIFDEQGKVIGTTGYSRDITERKRADEALRQSEARHGKMVANIGDVIVIIDHNGINRYKSPNLEKWFGWKPEELVGASAWDNIHPEDLVSAQQFVGTLVEKANATGSSECRYRCKDDHYKWIEFTGVNLLHDPDIQGVLGNYKDISERKISEEKLQESEQRFKALHNASFGGIAIHDKGLILECNQGLSEITGYSLEELIGMNGLLLIAPSSRELVMNRIGMGYEKPYEALGIRKNGEEYPLRLEARIIPYKGKSVRTVEFRNISEYKQYEAEQERLREQLFQAQKMESVGQLAGGVAHDFNNMLGVILGHAELAMGQTDSSRPIFANLEEIRKAATRSADITRQLLAFARKQTVAPKVLNLNEMVEGMLKMLRRLIGENIDLVWLPETGLWPIKMDPSQIDQILANLCVNARDAIVGIGKMTVETGNSAFDEEYCDIHAGFVPGEYVRIAVSDNGKGMDKETLAHIFEPFFTTKGVGEGTGLGLATVYGAVKQNNGFINAYSESGQGTTFTIYLPRYAGEAEQMRKDGATEPEARGDETILLVEDEPTILRMTTTMLQRLGYTVLAASTPSEAMRLAGELEGEVHLLLTDVIMPEMNGRALAENLFARQHGIKCLFMSGYTANVISHHGVLDDGMCFIQKPFSIKELATKIRAALESKKEIVS